MPPKTKLCLHRGSARRLKERAFLGIPNALLPSTDTLYRLEYHLSVLGTPSWEGANLGRPWWRPETLPPVKEHRYASSPPPLCRTPHPPAHRFSTSRCSARSPSTSERSLNRNPQCSRRGMDSPRPAMVGEGRQLDRPLWRSPADRFSVPHGERPGSYSGRFSELTESLSLPGKGSSSPGGRPPCAADSCPLHGTHGTARRFLYLYLPHTLRLPAWICLRSSPSFCPASPERRQLLSRPARYRHHPHFWEGSFLS